MLLKHNNSILKYQLFSSKQLKKVKILTVPSFLLSTIKEPYASLLSLINKQSQVFLSFFHSITTKAISCCCLCFCMHTTPFSFTRLPFCRHKVPLYSNNYAFVGIQNRFYSNEYAFVVIQRYFHSNDFPIVGIQWQFHFNIISFRRVQWKLYLNIFAFLGVRNNKKKDVLKFGELF